MDDAARTVSQETDCPKDDHNDRDCIKEIAHFVKFLLNVPVAVVLEKPAGNCPSTQTSFIPVMVLYLNTR